MRRSFMLLCAIALQVAPLRAQPASQYVLPRKFVDAGSWVCAIDPHENVQCWLHIQSGSWPSPTLSASPRTFQKVPGVAHAVAIDGDEDYVCSLDRAGSVHCWGSVWTHERQRLWPVQISLPGPARQVAVSGGVGCALLASSQIQCWGVGRCMSGMRSDKHIELSEQPEAVELPFDVVQLSAGHGGFCALDKQGSVTCWGELCPDFHGPQCTPTRMKLSGVRAIASLCGIVGKERELHCWGGREGWQSLAVERGCSDTRLQNIKHVQQLAVGRASGIALTDEGDVYSWGDAHAGGIADIGSEARAPQMISLEHAAQQGNTRASFEAQAPEVHVEPSGHLDRSARLALAPKRLPSVPGVRGVIASGHYNCLELESKGPYCEFVLGRVQFRLENVWPDVRFDPGRAGSLDQLRK